jgi:hypothetical protein
MRPKRPSLLVVITVMFIALFLDGLAQVNKSFQVGDQVEANYAGDWLPATIIQGYEDTEFGYGRYTVRWNDGMTSSINAEYVRALKPKAAPAPQRPEASKTEPAGPAVNQGKLQPNTPVLYRSGGPLWYEGWIVSYDSQKRQYRLQTPSGSGDIVPCHCVFDPKSKPDNSFFMGQWEVRVTGATSTFTEGSKAYRRYSAGMKLPPLDIRPDGTYLWRTLEGATISGRWQPRNGVPGITLLKGVDGKDWTLYEKTEGYAPTSQTRDEIGFHDLKGNDGYLSAYRIGANRSCVLKGRSF